MVRQPAKSKAYVSLKRNWIMTGRESISRGVIINVRIGHFHIQTELYQYYRFCEVFLINKPSDQESLISQYNVPSGNLVADNVGISAW